MNDRRLPVTRPNHPENAVLPNRARAISALDEIRKRTTEVTTAGPDQQKVHIEINGGISATQGLAETLSTLVDTVRSASHDDVAVDLRVSRYTDGTPHVTFSYRASRAPNR